ncbi:MAG: helix-turn-helix transcriptional regulator [Leptolyngbyaceae cyanobacterium]
MTKLDFSETSINGSNTDQIGFQSDTNNNRLNFVLLEKNSRFIFNLLNNYGQGILILSDKGDIVYINKNGQELLLQMNQAQLNSICLPREIDYLFKFQSDIHSQFSTESWSMTISISTSEYNIFDIQTRWIHLKSSDNDCLLFVMEDSNQKIKEVILKQAIHYGLTPRETDVWLLNRLHYTYKEIAVKLTITPSTVKKHMRNILAKQRLIQEQETPN